MPEQFIEFIKSLLAIKFILFDIKDRGSLALQIIADNWGLPMTESIKAEVKDVWYLKQIALVFSLYKDSYEAIRYELNYHIIHHILSKNSQQSAHYHAFLIDCISVLNLPNCHKVQMVIMFQILQAMRVWIDDNGILRAELSVSKNDTVN